MILFLPIFIFYFQADTTTTEFEIMTGAVLTARVDNTKSLIVEEYQLVRLIQKNGRKLKTKYKHIHVFIVFQSTHTLSA